MKNIILPLSLALLFLCIGMVKDDNSLKEILDDGEYFFSIDDYNEAFPSFLKIYENGYQHNAMINYRLGICCLNIDEQKKNAPKYLEESVKNVLSRYQEVSLKTKSAPVDAYLYLGNAYRINNDLDKAINSYRTYLQKADPRDNASIEFTDQEIKSCDVAKKMMANPVNVKITNLGIPVNSALSQYNPVVNENEDVLVYMESQKFYEAVICSRKIDGKWTEPLNITPDIGSDGDMFVSSVSADGNHLFLARDDNFNSDINETFYKDGNWQKYNKLKSSVNSKFWESNASISADGMTIYFASNRSGGYGGMDIYKSEFNKATSQWGPPVNLGTTINSRLNEDCPVILSDNKTLFFSSQGHYNMGGYDLFYSKMDENGKWSEPQNMGYPINTTDDDLNYHPVKDGAVVYLSRFLSNGMGKRDIYRFEKLPAEVISNLNNIHVSNDMKNETTKTEPGELISAKPINKKTTLIKPVFFGYNEYTLDQGAKNEIIEFVKGLKEEKKFILEVVGNTDGKGNLNYNQNLSEKRASEVREYLIKSGISPENIVIKGLGKTNPVALNTNNDGSDNPVGRKLNRRVEFNLLEGNNENIIIETIEIPDYLKIKK